MAMAANRCPECGVFVKGENLPSHLRKAHGMATEATRLERERPRPRARARTSVLPVWVIVLVVIAGLTTAGAYLAYQVDWSTPGETPPPLTEMCVQHTGLGIHNHAHLAIEILGNPYAIPAYIGIVGDPATSTCYRPLHTHDASGTIHIELPGPRTVYRRDFFAIWEQPFSRDRILSYSADATYEIVMSVGGVPSGAYENLIFLDGQQILIEYRAV